MALPHCDTGEVTYVLLCWDIMCLLPRSNVSMKLSIFSKPSVLTFVLGAQENRLIETVLLSTHNICFG